MGNLTGNASTQDSSNVPIINNDITVNTTGVAGATTITIPAVAGQLAYLSSFEIYTGGATTGALVVCTITGLKGGAVSIPVAIPTGPALASPYTWVAYDIAIPASGVNTAIVLTIPAAAGRTNCAGTLRGFYL